MLRYATAHDGWVAEQMFLAELDSHELPSPRPFVLRKGNVLALGRGSTRLAHAALDRLH